MIITRHLEMLTPALTPVSVKAIARYETITPKMMIVTSRHSTKIVLCTNKFECNIYVVCRILT